VKAASWTGGRNAQRGDRVWDTRDGPGSQLRIRGDGGASRQSRATHVWMKRERVRGVGDPRRDVAGHGEHGPL
ncbi:hypothetical protein LEMLEM_LOCUS22956, partial [Lemmus lemmus]